MKNMTILENNSNNIDEIQDTLEILNGKSISDMKDRLTAYVEAGLQDDSNNPHYKHFLNYVKFS